METRRGTGQLPRAGGAWRWCAVLVLLAGLFGGWLPTAPVARAAGIVVNNLADVTANDGACTLREAIVAANTDATSGAAAGECAAGSGADTITFQSGLTGTITLISGELEIITDLTITGLGAGLLAVSGGDLTRVFGIYGGTVTIAGLTIKDGHDIDGGAGLAARNAATRLTLNNLDFTGNVTTNSGGALYVGDATVLVANSTFSGNTAGNGGAIRSFGAGTIVSVTGSTFSGNTATNVGGAIEAADGTILSVASSTFTKNDATNAGGGIEVTVAGATVTGSTFSLNTAGRGGGLEALANSSLTLVNSTISGNSATLGGGIISTNSSIVTLENVTFVGNSTDSGAQVDTLNGNLTARNTIVTGAGAACGGVTDGGGNLQYSTDDPSSTSCGAAVPVGDPLLGPLQNNGGPTFTHLPASGSPAIDAGDNIACAAVGAGQPGGVDQRGVPRPQGLRCDAGAVEVAPPAAAPTLTGLATSPAPVVAGAGGAITLTLDGTSFADGFSTVRVNGLDTINGGSIATTFVSATRLTAALPAFPRGAAGQYVVTVLTSPPGGGSSNPLALTVANPTPALTVLAPLLAGTSTPGVLVGSGDTALTLTGSGFTPGATVAFGDATLIPTAGNVSATSIAVTIPVALLATARVVGVTVTNPGPGGGTSGGVDFTVANATPTLTDSTPATATAGDGATSLTVTGTGFAPGTTLAVGGTTLATTLTGTTSASATIPAALLQAAGTLAITATVPGPGGGTAGGYTLVVNPSGAAQLAFQSGSPQSAAVTTAFGTALAVTVRDPYGNPVADGTTVTFTAPSSGASGTFAGGGTTATATTTGGAASAPAFTANGVAGAYTVLVSAGGGALPLSLTNTPGPATRLVVSGPAGTVQAGSPSALTVTARDAGGNATTGYTGTVRLTSGDAAATLPADHTFTGGDAGTHTFTVTLRTGGAQTVTATDTANAALTASTTVNVAAPITAVVTASATGQGGVSPSGAMTYTAGSTATYAATPAAGQVFVGWTLDGQYVGYASPLTFTVNANRTLVAAFVARPTFGDVPSSDPDYRAITTLAALGIVNPAGVNGSGQFQPERQVARAEIAALIARTFGWASEFHANPFPDKCDPQGSCVDDALWNAVAALADYGVVGGYADGATCQSAGTAAPCYLPRDQVSRLQVVSIVARAFTKTPDLRPTGFWERQAAVNGQYTNVPEAGSQRSDLATYRANAGAIPGQASDGTFPDPTGAASRRFIAQVLWQAYAQVYGGDNTP